MEGGKGAHASLQSLQRTWFADEVRKKEKTTMQKIFNGKFIMENVAKGIWNAIGTLIVYGIVAWLIIKHGWSALKDAMAVKTMSVVSQIPSTQQSQLPPRM
jgi:hypothetical protein